MNKYIITLLFLVVGFKNSFANELPVLNYKEQPVLKSQISNAKIVKFENISEKEVKKQEKVSTSVKKETFTSTSSNRRVYKSCSSFGWR